MSPGTTVSELRSAPAPYLAPALALKRGVANAPQRGTDGISLRCGADCKRVVRTADPAELLNFVVLLAESDRMQTSPQTLSITWSSWPLDWERVDLLSTLAVFYDEVWLPYPFNFDPDARTVGLEPDAKTESALGDLQRDYLHWRRKWHSLFSAGILRHLDEPSLQDQHRLRVSQEAFQLLPPEIIATRGENYILKVNLRRFLLTCAQSVHLICGESPFPELFVSKKSATDTSRLAGFLVEAVFRYQVPHLQRLDPEQILEVREETKDTREGFRAFVFQKTNELEQFVRSGDSEASAAVKTTERTLIPEYLEMRRQIQSKKTGFWGKVLAAGGEFLQVDAAPWTPKFYGALLAMFGEMLGAGSVMCDLSETNRSHAIQFMASLERKTASVE